MATEYSRTERVGDQIQKELATLIQWEMKDPRLGMVTINEVKVSRDFSYAEVYITVLGQDLQDATVSETSVEVLNKAAGFLRSQLGRKLTLRTVPALRFHYDQSIERGRHLSSLIDKAVRQDEQNAADDSSASDASGADSATSTNSTRRRERLVSGKTPSQKSRARTGWNTAAG